MSDKQTCYECFIGFDSDRNRQSNEFETTLVVFGGYSNAPICSLALRWMLYQLTTAWEWEQNARRSVEHKNDGTEWWRERHQFLHTEEDDRNVRATPRSSVTGLSRLNHHLAFNSAFQLVVVWTSLPWAMRSTLDHNSSAANLVITQTFTVTIIIIIIINFVNINVT